MDKKSKEYKRLETMLIIAWSAVVLNTVGWILFIINFKSIL